MRYSRMFALAASLAIGSVAVGAQNVTSVIYPAPESKADVRFADLIELITGALEATKADYGPYTLGPSAEAMSEGRYLSELKTGTALNLAWSSTSEEKEQQYIPIRIPLNKGLIGFRVCLTSKEGLEALSKVSNLDDFRKLTVGQGLGWGDSAVYKANGIKVVEFSYSSLFELVGKRRFDVFPTGLNTLSAEFAANKDRVPNLAIDDKLLIYYPWPYYLFVSPKDKALAARLEVGLKRLIANGSFDAIFQKYHGKEIRDARLSSRTLITLNNPLLPKATPLADKALWFDPATGK